jgi:hypothetical protein
MASPSPTANLEMTCPDQPAPAPARQESPLDQPPRESFIARYSLWILLALTIFGGVIRYATYDKPSLWTDEAYTFRRVTSTYQDLLDVLQDDGFAPLNYEIYWTIAHFLGGAQHLTPFWMRIVPCTWGTLMVPAMYFLARQLASKRASLLVAAFTACSAYMMVYSHDAKMYMLLWLSCATSIGALLWWFRTNLRIAWLAWIAAGIVAGGTHAPGLVLLGIEPLFMLTQRKLTWQKFLMFMLGLAVIGSAPGTHYFAFNRWREKVEDNGWNSASGLGWVPQVLSGRTGPDMALYVATAYLFSWEWPRESYRIDDPSNRPDPSLRVAGSEMFQGYNIPKMACAGLMTAVAVIFVCCGVGLLPWPRRWRGELPGEGPPEPWWRPALWLSLWMVLPAYAFYCVSCKGMGWVYAKPSDWNDAVGSLFNDYWMLAIAEMLLLAVVFMVWRKVPGFLAIGLAITAFALFNAALLQVKWTHPLGLNGKLSFEFEELWRLGQQLGHQLSAVFSSVWIVCAAVLLLPPLAWYYSGGTLWERNLRAAQFLLIIAGLYGACILMHDQMDFFLSKKDSSDVGPIWMPRYLGMIWPAFAIAVCILLMRLPTRALRYIAIAVLLSTNLAQAYGRLTASEPRIDLMVEDMYRSGQIPRVDGATTGQDPAGTSITYIESAPGISNHPALGIIGNGSSGGMAARYYVSIKRGEGFSPNSFRSINFNRIDPPVTIHDVPSPTSIASAARINSSLERIVVWDRLDERPRDPQRELRKYQKALATVSLTPAKGDPPLYYMIDDRKFTKASIPQINRTIQTLEASINAPEKDPILGALGVTWQLRSEDFYIVRFHWNDSELYTQRRREYVKVPQPPAPVASEVVAPVPRSIASRPATRPTTHP